EVEEMLHFGLTKLAECGITCCQSDDLKAIPAAPWRTVIQAYKNLEAKGEMPVRIYEQCLCGTVAEYEEFLAEGHRTGQGDIFKIGPLKLLLDGSLGARTAALTKPYVGTEDQYGILVHSQETMNEFVTLAQKNDMQIAVHCIGDKAMEVTLEAVEVANAAYPRTDCRHGIVHAQLTTKEILERMAKDEIVAYIQPVFVPTDMDITEARVGYDWMQETYAWKTMNDLGILTVGGSDAPVESFDVMDNLYFAVTRQKKNGFPEGGWLPHEKVSAYEAVEMFTTHAAKAMFSENELGQVKEGFKADLVVLAEDVFAVEDAKIKDIAICETIMNGKTTYKA
ncbi:MAG: amidohydrolase family protein, partial [Firmicutes bacterium]|nr:amidohydrolase family protein [Bacillota bacterium]